MRPNSKSNEYFHDGQIAKAIYLRHMSGMKEILNLGEIKFGNRNSDPYKYFKKVVMDSFYTAMLDVFESYEREGLIQECGCGTTIRDGYKSCPDCSGSGWSNTDAFNGWFDSTAIEEAAVEEYNKKDDQDINTEDETK